MSADGVGVTLNLKIARKRLGPGRIKITWKGQGTLSDTERANSKNSCFQQEIHCCYHIALIESPSGSGKKTD